ATVSLIMGQPEAGSSRRTGSGTLAALVRGDSPLGELEVVRPAGRELGRVVALDPVAEPLQLLDGRELPRGLLARDGPPREQDDLAKLDPEVPGTRRVDVGDPGLGAGSPARPRHRPQE